MKKFILVFMSISILSACSDKDEEKNITNEVIGKWKLIETYADPGDGSGEYQGIDSEKTIEFFSNGTFVINGPLCSLSTITGEETSGEFNLEENVLVSNEGCEYDEFSEYRFGLEESYLIISWTACIEGCAQKYERL